MSLIDFLLGRPGQRELLIQILDRLTTVEERMSELDTSVDEIAAVIDELITDITTPADDLAAALAKIVELNAQLTATEDADAAKIAALTAERDALLADQVEKRDEAPGGDRQGEGGPADPGGPGRLSGPSQLPHAGAGREVAGLLPQESPPPLGAGRTRRAGRCGAPGPCDRVGRMARDCDQ